MARQRLPPAETDTVYSTIGWRERFNATLSAAVDAIIIIDAAGLIETVNTSAEKLFGYRREELVGRNVKVLMPEPYAAEHDGYIRNYLESGVPKIIGYGREVLGRRRDGSTFPIDLAVGEGIHGERRFFVGLIRDISQRKTLELQLRQREEELRQTQENAPLATAILTPDGRVIEANAACSGLFGYSHDECADMTLAKLMHPDGRVEVAALLERLASRQIETGELDQRFVAKDGRELFGTLHVSAVWNAEHKPERLVVQVVDRTQQVLAERAARLNQERLAHVNRLSTLGEMAAGIAHEVNQPLGAISNYAQACRLMLDRGRGKPEELSEILDKISVQARRAGEVIRRLRLLAKRHESSRELIRLNELARDIVKLAEVDARLLGLSIELDLAAELPPVLADGVQIQQVVLNLLRNGMEAMRDGGSAERSIILRTALASAHEVELAVVDFGPGIDPEVRDAIMSPFVTTKDSGMGMGLAICQSIVAAHGGRLWFTSDQLAGATFHFTLPAEPAEEQHGDS